MIEAGTVERTILGSDLGQQGNPRLVDGFRNVIETSSTSVMRRRGAKDGVGERGRADRPLNDNTLDSVAVVAQILDELAAARGRPLGVTQLARQLEHSKARMHRYLTSLRLRRPGRAGRGQASATGSAGSSSSSARRPASSSTSAGSPKGICGGSATSPG